MGEGLARGSRLLWSLARGCQGGKLGLGLCVLVHVGGWEGWDRPVLPGKPISN